MANHSREISDFKSADEKFAKKFYAGIRFNAAFLGITGVGFVVIYLLTQFHLLGEPAPQLLYIAGDLFFFALMHIPAMILARSGRGLAANFFEVFTIILFAVLLTAFWDGVVVVSILIILVAPVASYWAGLHRKYFPSLLILVILGIAATLLVNNAQSLERLGIETPAAVASLAFLGTIGILLVTVTIISRSRRYQNLRNQLLISFVIIVTIPALLAAILSAVGAYVNNETQVLGTLESIAVLKEDQINVVLDSFRIDAVRLVRDSRFTRNALILLKSNPSDLSASDQYRSATRARLEEFQSVDLNVYQELMVLNVRGEVVVSTVLANEGKSYQSELFYIRGNLDQFMGFSNNPIFGNANLIFATPFYDTDGAVLRGILVFRANSNLIKSIVEETPSFSEIETYLLEKRLNLTTDGEQLILAPLTKTRTVPPTYATQEMLAILDRGTSSRNVYENYAAIPVLGYYKKLDALDAYIVAELPREYVLRNSINSLLSSSALAIFAIFVAIAAISISAESIADPISSLAETTAKFAAGQLTARVAIDRRDEIGTLAKTYNQMADQLQDIIGKLEQRVADRTSELEDQSLRLRISAEIARDAASSHKLSTLLERAGSLIQERFGLHHTGIFLIDANREYAVLAASPTEAGQRMIEANHKLRVGEVGIVGRVAFTGDPRISLDTGSDAVYFNNPFLPKTRSEMALALKVENRIIGVLDVQSDQPQAFDENDIAIMQILADQLATAIERTRLLEQVEQNLSELEQAYGRFTREGWKTLGEGNLLNKTGYRFDNVRIQSISDVPTLGEEAMVLGSPVFDGVDNHASGNSQVAIPIKLRGQVIGVVSANLKNGFTQNTITTLELAIERLALSLESARLYEEARLRADREHRIAQVSSTISSATDFDAILRTTIEEVGRSLPNVDVSIQIIGDTE